MLTSGSGAGTYYRLDNGNASPAGAASAANSGSTATSGSVAGNFQQRPSAQAATASSTPFPIAPAPMPVPPHMMQPAPVLPYHQPPQMPIQNGPMAGAQSQIICSGCKTLLLYPNNASNVRCALCTAVTQVPASGNEMAQLVCGGCRTLLMYVRGASSVQCSCCHTVNLAMETSQVAHINCGGCNTTLMYQYGAPSVRCAVCQYITNASQVLPGRHAPPQNPMQRPVYPSGQPLPVPPSQAQTASGGRSQTVVVENPMTMDDSGKLVNSVSVGVSTEKKG